VHKLAKRRINCTYLNRFFFIFCSGLHFNIGVIKLRRMAWARHIARTGEINPYKILVGKSERKRPVGRPRYGWDGS